MFIVLDIGNQCNTYSCFFTTKCSISRICQLRKLGTLVPSSSQLVRYLGHADVDMTKHYTGASVKSAENVLRMVKPKLP